MLDSTQLHYYLQRIGVDSLPSEPSLLLRTLHIAHLRNIPFENLDVVFKRKITLSQSAIYKKVIENGRGGFCYELNYGFYLLLKTLGFTTQLLSGRVFNVEGYGAYFDHLLLLVDLDNQTLIADVSFGDSFCIPLLLDGTVSHEDAASYKIIPFDDGYQLLQKKPHADWAPLYIFDLHSWQLDDFAVMADYHQTSPQSLFTKKSICSRVTEDGRITLSDNQLIITRQGNRTEDVITDCSRYIECLSHHLGIRLPEDYNVQHWFDSLASPL
ncbi:arylamine N-acetyltransferase [Prodigiosinella confusarubida]|uniref:Arylamine N-acetyltransferase n=1 Tax=Serratia sp. (strain ATCC 39006) TaxID=104623 RepID=A0A2I5T7F4_SERS3|nr:arylamine N-acetyltransferase [Serratia sp. ATCC 39006]AUH00442.1 arylamine N-acetyltransferase [Serratia sp. ATCC 39006]AUH04762.1 arylamine N-acetyltransferase [Serratia sp. ATCC 39006]